EGGDGRGLGRLAGKAVVPGTGRAPPAPAAAVNLLTVAHGSDVTAEEVVSIYLSLDRCTGAPWTRSEHGRTALVRTRNFVRSHLLRSSAPPDSVRTCPGGHPAGDAVPAPRTTR